MHRHPSFVIAGALGAGAIALAACTVQTAEPGPPPPTVAPTGSLVVDWSIDGGKDPALCTQSAAAAIRITVYFGDGTIAGNFEQSCSAFAARVALGAGSYSASTVLIDAAGAPRTTAVPINPFAINAGVDFETPIDFPRTSFY